ncbi:MAG TPA: YezD family protein [Gemmatimonadales bacterium]|nr:YezD family protein [Gemmatimonadales bacterium]
MTLHPSPRDEPQREAGPEALSPAILHALREALRTIRYGTVELVIHDGRVVQLERSEKVRFESEVSDRKREPKQ